MTDKPNPPLITRENAHTFTPGVDGPWVDHEGTHEAEEVREFVRSWPRPMLDESGSMKPAPLDGEELQKFLDKINDTPIVVNTTALPLSSQSAFATLDEMMAGGLPAGRIASIFGHTHTFDQQPKSWTIFRLAAELQRQGKSVVFLSPETIGLGPDDDMKYARPQGETADLVWKFLHKDENAQHLSGGIVADERHYEASDVFERARIRFEASRKKNPEDA